MIALDLDPIKVSSVRAGESYIEDISSERLRDVLPRIRATYRYADLAKADAVVICVPTPLTDNREPDLGPLEAAGKSLAQVLQPGQLIVLESTTYPGTTRELLMPLLESTGLRVGPDINLAFSPERVDPGRTDYTLRTTPKVIGGITPACLDRVDELYRRVCEKTVRVSTAEAAELTKLLENIFRSVNIALVNEMAVLAERMGIDIWEVVDAASTKPYGFMRFEPGPGMGGHCLPVDPFYLTWRAREFHMSTEFIELAGKINQFMPVPLRRAGGVGAQRRRQAGQGLAHPDPRRQLQRAASATSGSRRRCGSSRYSTSRGGIVSYHDNYVPSLPPLGLESVPLDEAVAEADVVVLVTAHPEVDYASVAARSALFVDLRGVTRGLQVENLVRL